MKFFRQSTTILICISAFFLYTACNKKEILSITPFVIPVPVEQKTGDGVFILEGSVALQYDEMLKPAVELFTTYVEAKMEVTFDTASEAKKKIVFKVDNTITADEGYQLHITSETVVLSAKNVKGAFWGVQTLRQLLPTCFENASCGDVRIGLQAVTITDAPQFVYRGMHLDVGRHFFPAEFIKRYIDMMALLKMNTFHWHLTEDQGWRIEIKKYPKLTTHAAFRKETITGHNNKKPQKFDGKRYGGFYTQEEVKNVVAYAASRGVTIIPEIEMPGHSQAAISAYPKLGCTGAPIDVATKWGVFEDIYCTTEDTFNFLEDVLDEVTALFPGEYIHIGGDEAPKARWKACTQCQDRIKKEGLKDEHELQSYFIARIEKYLNSKGRQIVGWDEILEGGLAPNATVMSWRGIKGAVEAAKQGHTVIMTPTSHCYFDYYQSKNENEPLAIGGFLPLEKVYNFTPVPEELTAEEVDYVLGAQGNVWTEYMKTTDQVEYMVFPRAVAMSEVVWAKPENKNYDDFLNRLKQFHKRLDALDITYANHLSETEK